MHVKVDKFAYLITSILSLSKFPVYFELRRRFKILHILHFFFTKFTYTKKYTFELPTSAFPTDNFRFIPPERFLDCVSRLSSNANDLII